MIFTTFSPFQGSNLKWHFSPEFCPKIFFEVHHFNNLCSPNIPYVSARFLAASAAHFI